MNRHVFHQQVTPLHLYENNYRLLLMLFPPLVAAILPADDRQVPAFHTGDRLFAEGVDLQLTIEEIHKYTTTVVLRQELLAEKEPGTYGPWGSLKMRLQLYHDAKMVEVTHFQGSKKLKKYDDYPNKHMYQTDEKKQLNFHLQTILKMGLKYNKDRQKSTRFPLIKIK